MTPHRIVRSFLILLLLAAPPTAMARTLEGVELPDTLERGGELLHLNGAGIREKFFFDIYLAALYLPEPQTDAQAILAANPPWRLRMHFLYRKVGQDKLADGWEAGFAANLTAQELAGLRARLDHFKSLFPTLHKGDEVILDHFPGQGVSVTIRGQTLGRIQGDDFARALLSVWLGPEPVTQELKRALLTH